MKLRALSGLLFFPLLGVAFFLFAAFWIAPSLTVLWGSPQVKGQICAMVRYRTSSSDTITGIDNQLELTCRNGDTVTAYLQNHVIKNVEIWRSKKLVAKWQSAPPSLGGKIDTIERWASPEGMELLREISRGGMDDLRRIMMREQRLALPISIKGLTKTETAKGWFDLRQRPMQAEIASGDQWRLRMADGSLLNQPQREISSRARFGSYIPSSNGVPTKATASTFDRIVSLPHPPNNLSDFAMFDGGVQTEYRPVVLYTFNGTNFVTITDLGKFKGESSAFRLFGSCYMACDPAHPEKALMVADLESLGSRGSLLRWFASASEAIFSRWVYPTVFVSFGVFCLVFGGIAISLAVFPFNKDVQRQDI